MSPACAPRWLLLVHHLPPRPSNLRVRAWRRLQQVGAVVLRNSIYVLPATEEAREDVRWIQDEIRAAGGDVSVLEASAIDGYTDNELVELFRSARSADFQALTAELVAARGREDVRRTRAGMTRERRRFRERLATIVCMDYFAAPGRTEAEAALARLGAVQGPPRQAARRPALARRDFASRTWVTRPRPGIDRMASAWIIRRFIDPRARFAFGNPEARSGPRQVPFDMAGVEFGHHGEHCTFETLMDRFGLSEAPLVDVARVVHDLDLKEHRYGMPEAAAIGRLVDGLRRIYADDGQLLEQGMVMIDALYRSFAADSTARGRRRRAG